MTSFASAIVIVAALLGVPLGGAAGEIHDAVRAGDLAKVKALVAKDPQAVNEKDTRGRTPLHFASYQGNGEIIAFLLAHGADAKAADPDGFTPLHWAASAGQADAARALMAAGADPNARGGPGVTTLESAFFGRHPEAVEALLEGGLKVESKGEEGRALLHRAAAAGFLSLAEYLLAHGAEPGSRSNSNGTLLHSAAAGGLTSLVETLIDGGAKVNAVDDIGQTPLHLAASGGHGTTVSLLIAKGADQKAVCRDGRTLLHSAAAGGLVDLTERLIKNGFAVDARDRYGRTPLLKAAEAGSDAAAELLLARGAKVMCRDYYQQTPLHEAAFSGNLRLLDLLVKSGADVHAVNEEGSTPLLYVSQAGRTEVVERLLDYGARVDVRNKLNETPLTFPLGNGFLELVEKLWPIAEALKNKDLLEKYPLHRSAYLGNARTAAFLLGKGLPVELKDESGRTPFQRAAQGGNVELAQMLLDKGARVDAGDPEGSTPLHLATIKGRTDMVRFLLENKANPRAQNAQGRNALDLAKEYSYPRIAGILKAAGSEPTPGSGTGDVASLLAKPLKEGEAIVWSLGHCGFAVKTRSRLLIFDYLGRRGPRPEKPSLANGFVDPEEIKSEKVAVFVSHSHGDHFDPEILSWRSKVKNIIYIFGWNARQGDRCLDMPAPRAAVSLDGVQVFTVNCEHNDVPEVAYLVKTDGLAIYHSGDYTGPIDSYQEDMSYLLGKAGKVDIAFAGRLQQAESLKPKVVFPMHAYDREFMYGAFARQAAEKKLPSRVICPENKGDRWLLPLAAFSPALSVEKQATRISELTQPAQLVRETVLVKDKKPASVILHPDTEAGRLAAAAIVSAVRELTGCRLTARPGTAADARPDRTAILIGNVNSNPAMTLLYARFFTPVDAICPGHGGSLVHTVFDPFGKKVNAVVVGASDDAGLRRATDCLLAVIRQQKKGKNLALPRIFSADYSAAFRAQFPFAGAAPAGDRFQAGFRDGQRALDEGKHTSVAGELALAARRYQLNGDAVEAKLFVGLWDMYAKSAVDDPSKFGGPWGFDSDFVSMEVVSGWRIVENDPSLTDAERLSVTRSLGRWVSEPVVTSCADPSRGDRVLHNHETFPALGTLFAGLYFTEVCPAAEGPEWLKIADAQFRRQAQHFKPQEDCNGYQWLTNGHLFRYAVARPEPVVFENGNAKKIIDYCIGTMDNLGIQVPYGDTGSWKCWDSEMACLNVYAFATGDRAAAWASARKTAVKNYAALYGYCRNTAGETPAGFNGVRRWPLEPQYVQTFPPEKPIPAESLFDKISFRDGFDPAGTYLLLDGLSNGGHKHLDGNSLPRLTQFDRIWLADNDYFKTAVKYHNSLLVFRDGQATPIPAYTRFMGSGESDRFGYSQTAVQDYSGVDWVRTVVWLKRLGAFVVLDRLTAREASDYQFRLLWHGVGAASLSEKGLFLTQKGPSFWIQPAPGTRLELKDDAELGANWNDYPYADPFVRSLNATVYKKLARGESHLFATVLHGDAGGNAEPWALEHLENPAAVRLSAGTERMVIALGPLEQSTSYGRFRCDAGLMILDGTGLSLFSATKADIDGSPLHSSPQPENAEIEVRDSISVVDGMTAVQPAAASGTQTKIPAQKLVWERNVAAPGKTPDSGSPITRLAAASFDGPGQPRSILVGTAAGALAALNSDGTSRWEMSVPDKINDIAAADLDGDGRDDVVIGRQDAKVTALDPAGKEKWSRALDYYRRPPYVNVVRTGDLDGDGRPEVIAGGENWRFYAFAADGRPLWNYESVHPSRSGAVADLNGDGKAEVLCGTHYYWTTALNPDGTKRWVYGTFGASFGPICYDIAAGSFDNDRTRGVVLGGGDGGVHYLGSDGRLRLRYDTGDEVRKVLAADLDGDGRDEILAGSMSRSIYAFDASGRRLWRFEAGSPVNTLAFVAEGKRRRLLAGAESGDLYGFDATGKLVSRNSFGSPIVDLLAVENGVVVATSDGRVRRVAIIQ